MVRAFASKLTFGVHIDTLTSPPIREVLERLPSLDEDRRFRLAAS